MKLHIKNINKIASASIKLKGLTVITGDNDTGKSTIGKVLFALIKSLNMKNDLIETNKEKSLLFVLDKLYFTIVENEFFRFADRSKLKELFFPPFWFRDLRYILGNSKDELAEIDRMHLHSMINERKNFLKDQSFIYSEKYFDIIQECNIYLDKVKSIFNKSESIEKAFCKVFNQTLLSEFHSQISTSIINQFPSEIVFQDIESRVKIVFEENKAKTVSIHESYNIKLDDALYLETPIYLQLSHVLERVGVLFDDGILEKSHSKFNPKVPLHIKDLVNKASLSRYLNVKYSSTSYIDLSNFIHKVIRGVFVFDKKTNELRFKKSNSNIPLLHLSNTASGIKGFGLIDLLIKVGEISHSKMLILDEPENHLHPSWQLNFAELIVLLVKSGVPILVSSHSPYFIQGLRFFSKKHGLSNNEEVNYYLAKKNQKFCEMTDFEDVTDNLNKVFFKLAQPLNDILNLDDN